MKKVLFMLLVMFALSACQSKDSYVKEFSDFVDKVEMEAADYTDKDWKKADAGRYAYRGGAIRGCSPGYEMLYGQRGPSV